MLPAAEQEAEVTWGRGEAKCVCFLVVIADTYVCQESLFMKRRFSPSSRRVLPERGRTPQAGKYGRGRFSARTEASVQRTIPAL